MTPGRLGPYEVLDEIGGGGMGVVYLVATASGPAALKVLAPAWDTPATLRRFHREAEALRNLQHRGFVRYLDHGDELETPEGPRPFILMEYVEGQSLRERIRSGAVPPAEVLAIVAELAEALGHAHARGVVHRDLKPENIILEADTGAPRILDLGIARVPDDWQDTIDESTRAGEMLGTVRYMSPEQARGRIDTIGPPSDVYSLAVVTYELLTGQLPYDVHEETLPELLAAILVEPPVPLSRRGTGFPATLDSVLLSALDKDPAARPPSARAFVREVEAAYSGELRHRVRTAWRDHGRRRRLWGRFALLISLAGAAGWMLADRLPQRDPDLSGVYARLDTALDLVHFGDRTPDRLRAAIDTLVSARQEIWQGRFAWRSPLERYIVLRMGEAAYLLGMEEEDPERLRWASARYAEAAELSCTRREREQIPRDVPVRDEILQMPAHMPHSGQAMTLRALGLFDLPMRHLGYAELAASRSVSIVTGEWEAPVWDGPPFTEVTSERRRRIAQAIAWNDHGGILAELAQVSDSSRYLDAAISIFAMADSVSELQADRPAFASFQHQYGVALRQRGERDGNAEDLAESERRLRAALEIRRPESMAGAFTRAELALLQLARAELDGVDPANGGQLESALRDVEDLWSRFEPGGPGGSRSGGGPGGLARSQLAATRARLAEALARHAGAVRPAETADSLLAGLLSDGSLDRLPRARAVLHLERARLAGTLGRQKASTTSLAAACADSALAVLPEEQFPSLAREAKRVRSSR